MAHGIVNLLEVIEIHEHQSQRSVFLAVRSNSLLERFVEQIAVWKTRQWIVLSQVSQSLLGALAFSSYLNLAELPLYGSGQPLEITLHDIIVRARFHRLYRHVFADGAGDENEG